MTAAPSPALVASLQGLADTFRRAFAPLRGLRLKPGARLTLDRIHRNRARAATRATIGHLVAAGRRLVDAAAALVAGGALAAGGAAVTSTTDTAAPGASPNADEAGDADPEQRIRRESAALLGDALQRHGAGELRAAGKDFGRVTADDLGRLSEALAYCRERGHDLQVRFGRADLALRVGASPAPPPSENESTPAGKAEVATQEPAEETVTRDYTGMTLLPSTSDAPMPAWGGDALPPASASGDTHQAERAVLAGILLADADDPAAPFADGVAVLDRLRLNDFTGRIERETFRALQDHAGKKLGIDPFSIADTLKGRGIREADFAALWKTASNLRNADRALNVLLVERRRRELRLAAEELEQAARALDPIMAAEPVLERLRSEPTERSDEAKAGGAEAKAAEPVRPLFDTWPSASRYLAPPPPLDMLLDDLLPAGIVAGLFGVGGAGKSYLLAHLAAAFATGRAFGPIRPPKPRRVLALFGEDPPEIVHARLHAISRAMGLEMDPLFSENLGVASLCGRDRVLISFDRQGTASPTSTYHGIQATLEAYRPELLVIDPLSRFFSGSENDNSNATAFIALLERLTVGFGCGVLFAHHVAKADRGTALSEVGGRGASAFRDGLRVALVAGLLSDRQAEALDIPPSERRDYLVLTSGKANYSRHAAEEWFFKRDPDTGTLSPVNLRSARVRRNAELLRDLIGELAEPLTRRQLARPEGKGILAALKADAPGFVARRDLDPAVDVALREGLLIEKDLESGPKRTRVRVLVDPLAEGVAA